MKIDEVSTENLFMLLISCCLCPDSLLLEHFRVSIEQYLNVRRKSLLSSDR